MTEPQLSRRPIGNALLPQGIVFVVILVFVTVCAVLRNVNLLVVVSGTMSAVLLICWRLSRSMLRNTAARRLIPEEIHAGETIPIQWQVDNYGRSSIFNIRIEDQISQIQSSTRKIPSSKRSRNASKGVLLVEGIMPRDELIGSYRARFASRGTYRAGPAIVSVQFPLPLVKCWYRHTGVTTIHVAPAIGELLPGWHHELSQHTNRFECHASRRGSNQDDFFAIRNWNSGDSLRHIHWRSTAKVGQPMVRQFESYSPHTLAVAADLYADPDNLSDSLDAESAPQICEQILSLLATLLHQWRQHRTQKLFIAIADEKPTTHIAGQDADFAAHLHRRLATAQASRHPAVVNIIDQWNTGSSDSKLLILSSRAMPQEIQDHPRSGSVDWLHCNALKLQLLFQHSTSSVRPQAVH